MTTGSSGPSALAFKAYEIEELADRYFFRPLGMVFALAARSLHLTPTMVTIISAVFGMIGGALLAYPDRALLGFALIVFYSVLDSSDGQLARMTGQTSDFGQVMDGIGGYLAHIAIYAGIAAGPAAHLDSMTLIAVFVAAAISNVVHAQMYDYHRTAYTSIVIKGVTAKTRPEADATTGFLAGYQRLEHVAAGLHPRVEHAIARRADAGSVRADDRERYRRLFYGPVRAWNLFGDNTRIYAIGVLAWMQRLDWFYPVVFLFMNIALVLVWIWQMRRDREFLRGL